MLRKTAFIVLLLTMSLPAQAQVLESDSLALVALYDSTDGANWSITWDLNTPVNTWHGVTVSGGRVTGLSLNSNQLSGSIPAELGNLTNLTKLDLWNNQLSGSIPAELGNLTNLTQLKLHYNQLSGIIPAELGNLVSLTQLRLGSNQLSGSIPAELGNLANLTYLWLDFNQLSGPVPAELGNLANLTQLKLGSNQLSGPIPAELGNLANLTRLLLHSNQLSGPIPAGLGNLTNLTTLWLQGNQLSGSVPAELGNLANLRLLSLSLNQLSGSIPVELGDLANLTQLTLDFNQLSGPIPTELGTLANLQWLALNSNQLSGSIPAELGTLANLQWLALYSNQLSGSIPAELGDLANLQWLYLHSNQLSGSIPTELGNLVSLRDLWLHSNQLTGSIPAELGNLANLTHLYLYFNQLSGLPDLSPLAALNYLRVENNRLTFEDLEPNMSVASTSFTYAPQDSVGSDFAIVWGLTGHLTLSVPVGGTANVYQWMKDGVDIPGATCDTLSIPSVVYADSGSYVLRITNTIVTGLTLYSRPIHVSVVDDQFPVAVNDTAEVLEDSSVTIRILDNDSDPDGDTLIISDVTVPVHGTAVIDTGDISITYAPASDFFGQDTCSYVIHDGKGLLDTGEVFITVAPVNDSPVITSLVAAVATEDVYFIYRATATDVEGDSLSWTFDWRPGWLQFNADSVFGTPLEGATDTSFRAIVADSTLSDTLVVYLSVVAVNDPPEPFALLLPVDGDTVEIVNDSLLFVWESSADIEGDTLTYTFHIEGPGYDTTIADLTDTCLVLTGMAALSLDSLYTWSVDAFDETDTTSCLVEFQFIMPSTLGTDPLAMIPQEYALHQNYPNPFNPVSTIRYELPQASEVSLVVYDILGREVTKLVDGYLEQGYHQVQWDGRNSSGRELPSGIYIARLVIPPVAGQKAWGYSKSIKMVLLK